MNISDNQVTSPPVRDVANNVFSRRLRSVKDALRQELDFKEKEVYALAQLCQLIPEYEGVVSSCNQNIPTIDFDHPTPEQLGFLMRYFGTLVFTEEVLAPDGKYNYTSESPHHMLKMHVRFYNCCKYVRMQEVNQHVDEVKEMGRRFKI